jgi:ureidoglycolate lyase
MMERHANSFQSFIPLDASSYLVCVAPGGTDDLPAMDKLRAFIAPAGIAITYHANVWHHLMIALARPAQFAMLMWRSGGDDDEEFVDLSQSVYVHGT